MSNNVIRLTPKDCIGIDGRTHFNVATMTPEQKDRIVSAAIRVALCIEGCDDAHTNELMDALSRAVREAASEVPMVHGEYFAIVGL